MAANACAVIQVSIDLLAKWVSRNPSVFNKVTSEAVVPVIEAAAERIHYAEGRRTNYTVMAVALVAGGISVLVFALGSIGEMWLKYASLTIAIGFVLVGLLVLFVYGRQTNRYPYTSATTTWKWFYRDALPNRDAFKLKTFETDSSAIERITAAYDGQLPEFKKRIATLDNELINAEQDVEQLYSLHVNELYKNLYLSSLRSLFNWGLITTISLAFIAALAGLYLEARAGAVQVDFFRSRGWSQRVEYRLLSEPLADTAQVAVHITIKNLSSRPMSVSGLTVRDAAGWPLPVEVRFQMPFPPAISPHSAVDAYASISAPRTTWLAKGTVSALIK